MPDPVFKMTKLVGESPDGDGQVTRWQVTVEVAFEVEQ